MTRDQSLQGSPDAHWERYTTEQLLASCRRHSDAVRRAVSVRLSWGAALAVVLLATGQGLAAVVIAIMASAFAFAPAVHEHIYQLKLTAGGVGMAIEELRAMHLRMTAELD